MSKAVQAQFAGEKYSFGHGTVFPWGGNPILLQENRVSGETRFSWGVKPDSLLTRDVRRHTQFSAVV
jgi:hypothetical protein